MKSASTPIYVVKSAAGRPLLALVVGLFMIPGSIPAQQTSSSAAAEFSFASIDVPCADCPNAIARQTIANGINPAGDIVGAYVDAVGKQHGYLLSGGQFTTVDVPGTLVGAADTLPTIAEGISPSDEIVGRFTAPVSSAPWGSPAYCPAAGSVACIKGFLFSRGVFSVVLFPDHPGAIPQRILPDGTIYGCYHDFDLMASMIGFERTRFGYFSLAAAGGELADATRAVVASMNNGATPDGKTIVGLWADMMTGRQHGFVIRGGSFASYDVPGSIATNIFDLGPRGDFVGIYVDSTGKRHGFLQPADGSSPLTIDAPNAVHTRAFGINPGGAIVGQYTDANGVTHGFLAIRQQTNEP